jgi:nucleotide-binding universal stress UspA family protein
MSIKNILVGLAPRNEGDPGGNFAISMARALKAQVAGRIYALEPELGVGAFGGLPADLLKNYRATLKKEAQAAAKRFEEAAAKAKVQHSHSVELATLSAATADFTQVARTYDVTVLRQTEGGIDHVGDVFIENALFYSGRPVILVPKKGRSEFSLERVLIAWDGGANAARAVAASLPLLGLAKKVQVLTVGEKSKSQDTHADQLVQNLEKHGLDVELRRRSGDDIAKTILKEAQTRSASLMVMGAYGHSRLREFVFGGVTRFMTANTTLPVMMMQ